MKEQIDGLRAAFERLSSREQSLLMLVVVLLLVGIVGFGSYFTSRSIDRQERRIEAKLGQLREIGRLRADYQTRLREQQRLTGEVRNNAGTRILSFVERIAQQSGVVLKTANQSGGRATGSDAVVEESAKVTVDALALNELDDFLRKLDESNRLVVIRGVEIEPSFEQPKRLNATITVGTFKPSQEAR